MTRRSVRAGAAVLGSAALLAVAGCGGEGSAAPRTSATQGTQPAARAGGPMSEANVSALAKDLGVTTARLQEALAATRPAGAPNGRAQGGQRGSGAAPGGAGGRGGQLAAGLAEQLNLPTDKVQQALEKVMPRRPQGSAPQSPSDTP